MADETGSVEKTVGEPVDRGEEFSIYDEETVPDWLKEENPATPAKVAPAAPTARETPEMPGWLKDLSQAEGGEPVKAGSTLEEHIEESGRWQASRASCLAKKPSCITPNRRPTTVRCK